MLKMLRGISGSGKSTAARALVDSHESWCRINRDDIRVMLFNGKWKPEREDTIVECERAIARIVLSRGYRVVIDDTNLDRKHFHMWKEQAALSKQPFEVEQLLTPVDACILRDARRPNSVGPEVIKAQAEHLLHTLWLESPEEQARKTLHILGSESPEARKLADEAARA